MMRLALPLLMAASWTCAAQPVRIGVFGLFRPTRLEVRGPLIVRSGENTRSLPANSTLRCEARGEAVFCASSSGTSVSAFVSVLPHGEEFLLAVPGRIERRFRGHLEITARAGVLVPVAGMDRETAVASVVAAESPPGAPSAALEAQAVAARSLYAAGARHRDFDFCDSTHCQFLRQPPPPRHPASRAARHTRGLVLTWRGAPIAALYSARCGGITRPLPNPAPDEYPFFAVPCPDCMRLASSDCAYCTRTHGAWANRRGTGAGHGIGLCQNGSAAMASSGASFYTILKHYFPNAAAQPAAAGGY